MGKCEYVLVKDSVNNTFEVRQANEPCGNGSTNLYEIIDSHLPRFNN